MAKLLFKNVQHAKQSNIKGGLGVAPDGMLFFGRA